MNGRDKPCKSGAALGLLSTWSPCGCIVPLTEGRGGAGMGGVGGAEAWEPRGGSYDGKPEFGEAPMGRPPTLSRLLCRLPTAGTARQDKLFMTQLHGPKVGYRGCTHGVGAAAVAVCVIAASALAYATHCNQLCSAHKITCQTKHALTIVDRKS